MRATGLGSLKKIRRLLFCSFPSVHGGVKLQRCERDKKAHRKPRQPQPTSLSMERIVCLAAPGQRAGWREMQQRRMEHCRRTSQSTAIAAASCLLGSLNALVDDNSLSAFCRKIQDEARTR